MREPRGTRGASAYLRFAAILLTLGLVATACSSSEGESSDETTTTAAAPGETTTTEAGSPDTTAPPAESGGVLYAAVSSEPTDLDPSKNTTLPDRNVTINVFNSLVELNLDDYTLNPGLAKSWEYSEDGLTLTLYLEEGVLFHDGTEMTANDVAYTIIQNKDPDVGRTSASLSLVEDVVVVDDYTVDVQLSAPDALIPETLTDVYVRQDGWVFETDVLVGTGPFKFVRWDRNQEIVLEKNEDYWREGLPLLDEVHLVNVSDNSARVLRIEAGEVQMINQPPFTSLEQLQANPEVNVVVPTNGVGLIYDLRMRLTAEPWDNKLVRQALNYALDRDAIATALFGIYTPVDNPIASDSPFFAEDAATYPYDPDKARELLAEAGYPDGLDAGEFLNHFELGLDFEVLSQLIQAQAEAVGIRMEIVNYDVATWVDKYVKTDSEYGIGLSNGAGRPTPYDLINHTWGKGRPAAQAWDDLYPDYFELLANTRGLDPTSAEFQANIKEAQVIMMEELPSIVVGNKALPTAVRDNVSGFQGHPSGFMIFEPVSLTD